MLRKIVKAFIPYGILWLINRSPKKIIKRRLATANSQTTELYKTFEKIFEENEWGSSESRSGPGSELLGTRKLRKKLPKLWKQYGIKTVLDVPCGDYNWMKTINKNDIHYTGGDIVKKIVDNNNKLYGSKNVDFIEIDIRKDELPKVDMILCKDCLQHLSIENVCKTLKNFKRSGSKYLMVTSYPLTSKNWDINDGDCRPLNLLIEPFNLSAPLCKIHEGIFGGEIDRTEYFFELDKINV
jgi:2-polyprenyl-3-methyl-5-hydroxy-6-metoxy-1,4-benzoquinol methylase